MTRTFIGTIGLMMLIVTLASREAPAPPGGTFTVTNVADSTSGSTTAGSLRDGIKAANDGNCVSPCTISFGVTGNINLFSPLTVSSPNAAGLTIDGFSASGSIQNSAAFGNALNNTIPVSITSTSGASVGFDIGQPNVTIQGVSMGGFSTAAIQLASTGGLVQGCYIGTTSGTAAFTPQNGKGILITGSGNTVGGTTAAAANLIGGNAGTAVHLSAGSGNTLAWNYIGHQKSATAGLQNSGSSVLMSGTATGNFVGVNGFGNLIATNSIVGVFIQAGTHSVKANRIGTNGAGTASLVGTFGSGIQIQSPNNVIGGSTSGDGNLISGTSTGILLDSTGSGTTIHGNIIGLDLTGSAAVGNTIGISVTVGANGTIIGGTNATERNVISSNSNDGISMVSDNNTVRGNYIGMDASGTIARSNFANGISVSGTGNVIGGSTVAERNLISSNNTSNVAVSGSGNTVKGNYIGTNAAGTMSMTNAFNTGVSVNGANTVGGSAAGEGNLISGNGGGIGVSGTGAVILGNFIGLNAAGTAAVANQGHGISLGGTNATIGGSTAGARNVISGNNTFAGHAINISGGSGHIIKGNYIGTNAAGTTGVPNGGRGINALTATSLTIGGLAGGEGNVISGNNRGVVLDGGSGSIVRGNIIGRNAANTAGINNNTGILIFNNGIGHTIDQNTVASGNKGIVVEGTGSKGHVFTANAVHSNSAWQIDLGNDFSNTNDTDDADTSLPNNQQNHPTISAAELSGGNLAVKVSVDSSGAPGTTNLHIEVFKSPAFAEASAFLGSACFNTNLVSNAVVTINSAPVVLGDYVTATATNRAGTCASPTVNDGTSELSTAAQITPPTTPGVVTNTNDSGTGSLRQAITDANTGTCVSPCTITFNIPNTDPNFAGGVYTISPASQLPDIMQTGITLDGTTQTAFTGDTNVNGPEIVLNGTSAGTGALGLRVIAASTGEGSNITIRGVVIGNFSGDAIVVSGAGLPLTNITIQSNYIGTDASGTVAAPNASGILVPGSVSNLQIGAAGLGNLISGNLNDGVYLAGSGVTGATIAGNKIGTDRTGGAAIPNGGNGILILDGGSHTIGGSAPAANVIAHNGARGIAITGASLDNNLRQNSIFTNTNLGVDLANDGVTPNDAGDADSGPNGLQNFPVLMVASYNSGTNQTTISGTLNSLPSTQFDIDWYSNSTLDGSGYGEGQTYENTSTFTTDALGNTAVSIVLPGNKRTSNVVATASRVNGAVRETSEFSAPPPNNPPVANNDAPPATNEDTPTTFDPRTNDSDPEGGAFTITSNTQPSPAAGTVTCTTTSCTFTPVANYNGPASFNYTITDDMGATATATVNITVTAVNDPPVANADALGTNEDTPNTVNVLTNDTDIDGPSALTVTGSTNGTKGTVSCTTAGVCTYTPNLNQNGPDSFTYTVSDGSTTSVGTVNVTINAVNDPPVANADALGTNEDTPNTVNVLTNDSDVDGPSALTVTGSTNGTKGTVSCTTAGVCTYTPTLNQTGADSFTYTVSDGSATSVGTVNVTINAVNDPPVANADALGTNEDTPNTVNVLTNDTDVDGPSTLSVTGSTNGTKGTVSCTVGGTCTYTPNLNQTGADSFTYTVSDGSASSVGTVNVTITAVNDPPVANPDTLNTNEDTPNSVNVLTNDTDVDGPSTLSVTGSTNGTKGTVSCTVGGTCTYTPNLNQTGADSFTYTVSDGSATAVGTVNVTINGVNDAPTANPDALATNEDTPNTVNVLINDADGDGPSALTVTASTNGTKGTVSCTTAGNCTYTPTLNQTGADSFTYTVSDGSASSAGTVNVTINAVNDPPVANPDTLTTNQNTPGSVNVLANDSDVDGPSTLTVTGSTSGTKGTVSCNGAGNCVYTPNLNQTGPDAFTYTVSDGATTATGSVSVTITSTNAPPNAAADSGETTQGNSVTLNVLFNDSDPDGQPLTVISNTQPANGSVVCQAGGNCTYTPNAGFTGVNTFTYTIQDTAGATSTATVTINVRPCPGAPNALTPLNNATGVPTSGRLFWDNAGAQTYSVYLGRSDTNGCSTPFSSTDFTFADYANLQGNTRYSWRIEAITSGCPIVSSACNTFTTAANCNNATVTLVKPLGGTSSSPVEFEWQPVTGATEYGVSIKIGSGNFTEIGKSSTTKFTAAIVTDGTVQWFVTATIPGCGNVQSATATFTLCNRPATPLARVVGEATSAKTYSVEWDAVPNAIRYEVDEATNPNFTDAVTTSTDKTSVAFKHDATTTSLAFYYRVRAFSACTQVASDNSPAIRIVIIPVPRPEERNPNTNIPAGSTELVVQQVFIPGEPSQPAFFTAVTDRPWLTVRPPNGVLPPEGITLEVIADPGNLTNGTFTATVIVTITTPGAAGITSHGTTTTSKPISISLVTPVTPVQNKLTPSADSLIIASVGHLDGINSHWQSDIRVTNTSAVSSKYALTFTPSAGTASGIKQTTITVGGGETTALDDIIKNWFGIGSLGDSANGMLEIRSADNTPLTAIASSRTYNVTANGTLGQYIPALPFGGFVGKALGNAAPTILSMQQISQSSAYRTNVGIVEASGQSAAVILSVFNAAGLKLTDIPLNLAGGEQRQLNSILAANNITLSDGRVEVKVTGGDGKVTAYASVVDNKTNDPLLVSGVATNQLGSPKYVLPGVADLTNTLASWRTDMRIFNTSLASHTANLTLHLLGGGTPLTASVSLQPGEVRTLDDVVKSIFKVADVGGAVHVSTTSQANLVVTGRTYNQTTEGTYGQFIEAVTPERAAGAGGRTLHVLQVEDSVRYRTNLGIAEVSGAAATVEVQVILPDSKVTPTLTFTMAPNEFRQLGIVRDLSLGNVYNARLSVRVISGEGRVTAYGSVIDMTTQDPTYVPAQ